MSHPWVGFALILMILLLLEAKTNERQAKVAEYRSGNTQTSLKRDGRSLSRSQQYGHSLIRNTPRRRKVKRFLKIFSKLSKKIKGTIRKITGKIRKVFTRRRQTKKPPKTNNDKSPNRKPFRFRFRKPPNRKPFFKLFPILRRKRPPPRPRLPNPHQTKLLTRPATNKCKPVHRGKRSRHLRSVDETLEDNESYRNRSTRSSHDVHPGDVKVPPKAVEVPPKRVRPCDFRKKITCDKDSKYRTIDGSCNNLANPYWGMADTPLVRFVCSAFDDGVSKPRQRGRHGSLPEPRQIVLEFHKESGPHNEEKKFTHFLMAFGQLVSHDTLDNVVSRGPDGGRLDCCGDDKTDVNCIMPLKIKSDDPFFGRFGRTCLNFARSKASPDLKCNFDVRQTITRFTHYIDGSAFYGSDSETAENLRELVGGRLKTQNHPDVDGDLMPAGPRGCRVTSPEFKCFVSGDGRVNQQATLIGQHTIWLREHNKIAKKLEKLFGWNDEKLYQEARRIVVGIFQHITYDEYLPAILGKTIMRRFDLTPQRKGKFFKKYNRHVNPSIRQGFMTSAFRFGHSMVNDKVGFMSANGVYKRRPFRELFLKADHMYKPEGLEEVIRGLYIENCQSVDRLKSKEVVNHLFERGEGTGRDLIATNINRGRDHGVPNYMEFRKMCGLYTTTKFSGLVDHSPTNRRRLSRVYAHVNDLDLFTAGTSEEHLEGALVGPTFACLIGLQFKALKIGDRFFYENYNRITGFTLAQLDEIKKNTMAQVVCRNSKIGKIQEDVFTHGLPEKDCSSIEEDMNLSLWK